MQHNLYIEVVLRPKNSRKNPRSVYRVRLHQDPKVSARITAVTPRSEPGTHLRPLMFSSVKTLSNTAVGSASRFTAQLMSCVAGRAELCAASEHRYSPTG